MSMILDQLLQSKFIDSAVKLAEIQMNEDLTNAEKALKQNNIYNEFKRFIDDNYQEK